GTYPLTVRASGTGVSDATATFSLTVAAAGSFGLTATPNTLTLARGASSTVAIGVGRLGGFAGNVTLAVQGAPSGVTATLNPTSTTGTTSALTINVSGSAAIGASTLTVRGTADGQPERTVPIQLTVTAAGGGTAGSFVIGCLSPVWAAFQDGDGAWTQVTGTAQGAYNFSISAARGAFAFATASGQQAMVTIIRMTRAELTAAPQDYCGQVPSGNKFVNGSVAGLSTGDFAHISLGGSTISRSSNQAFSIVGFPTGTFDLVAFRSSNLAVLPNPSRGVIRRDLDVANASTLPVIDFTAGESFAAGTASFTVPNFAAGESYALTMSYRTGPACTYATLYQLAKLGQATSPVAVDGIPASVQRASDSHQLSLTAVTGSPLATAARVVQENFAALANRTMTLPPPLGVPAITTLPGTYKRLQGVYQLPDVFTSGTSFLYTSTTPIRTVVMSATAGWVGGTSATMAMPDFTGVGGWNDSWAPPTTATGSWAAQGSGSNYTSVNLCQPDGRIVSADQRGSF
ncbi:MAG: COG1470 family protein, partial [Gemmatimonadales bacterium]